MTDAEQIEIRKWRDGRLLADRLHGYGIRDLPEACVWRLRNSRATPEDYAVAEAALCDHDQRSVIMAAALSSLAVDYGYGATYRALNQAGWRSGAPFHLTWADGGNLASFTTFAGLEANFRARAGL